MECCYRELAGQRTEHEDVLRVLDGESPGVATVERGRVVVSVRDEGSRRAGVGLEVGLGRSRRVSDGVRLGVNMVLTVSVWARPM